MIGRGIDVAERSLDHAAPVYGARARHFEDEADGLLRRPDGEHVRLAQPNPQFEVQFLVRLGVLIGGAHGLIDKRARRADRGVGPGERDLVSLHVPHRHVPHGPWQGFGVDCLHERLKSGGRDTERVSPVAYFRHLLHPEERPVVDRRAEEFRVDLILRDEEIGNLEVAASCAAQTHAVPRIKDAGLIGGPYREQGLRPAGVAHDR